MINLEDSNTSTNVAHVCGEIIDGLKFSHRTYGEVFYTFEIGVLRNSGYEDQIIVMASERILSTMNIELGEYVNIEGQIRTYNEDVEGHNKLNIVIFARDITEADPEDEAINEIYLEGFLCKKPLQRTSPLGRKICDLMLAVNRMYNKSDYIPWYRLGKKRNLFQYP